MKLIILRGPAGVGKTTMGKLLKKRLGDSLLFNIDMICSDMIGGHPRKTEVRYAAHELCYLAAEKTLAKNLIFERLFLDQSDIDHIVKLFSKLKYKIIVITLKASIEKLIRQDSKRLSPLGSEDIKRLHRLFIESKVKTTGKTIEVGNKTPNTIVNEIINYLSIS
ncbi:hypothetical protein AUJ84_03975 [Candidatus Pacearchaeota archaeon CG1_02_32_132]|nr:MAG: hypothetical protein AUJ84_03975 [Candidatus Pacearchaeota archaeon CG1_02_32_132]